MADYIYYVYLLFRETGQPFYVGKGRDRRWLIHEYKARLGTEPNRHKASIILNMLEAGWTDIPKVKIAEHLTHDQACAYEAAWIMALGRHPNGPLVNLTDGGEGTLGRLYSDKTRAKLSASKRGKTPSEEVLARLRTAWLGRTHSAETRAKMAASARKRIRKPFSAEARARMGDSHRGRPRPAETREKIRASVRKTKSLKRLDLAQLALPGI